MRRCVVRPDACLSAAVWQSSRVDEVARRGRRRVHYKRECAKNKCRGVVCAIVSLLPVARMIDVAGGGIARQAAAGRQAWRSDYCSKRPERDPSANRHLHAGLRSHTMTRRYPHRHHTPLLPLTSLSAARSSVGRFVPFVPVATSRRVQLQLDDRQAGRERHTHTHATATRTHTKRRTTDRDGPRGGTSDDEHNAETIQSDVNRQGRFSRAFIFLRCAPRARACLHACCSSRSLPRVRNDDSIWSAM